MATTIIKETPTVIATNPQPVGWQAPQASEPHKMVVDTDASEDYQTLQTKWPELLELIKPFNHSLTAVCKNAHPLEITNNKIVLGCEYAFHVEQLNKVEAKKQLMDAFSKIFDRRVGVEVKIDPNWQNNHQKFKGRFEEGVGDIVDTFGGEVV